MLLVTQLAENSPLVTEPEVSLPLLKQRAKRKTVCKTQQDAVLLVDSTTPHQTTKLKSTPCQLSYTAL